MYTSFIMYTFSYSHCPHTNDFFVSCLFHPNLCTSPSHHDTCGTQPRNRKQLQGPKDRFTRTDYVIGSSSPIVLFWTIEYIHFGLSCFPPFDLLCTPTPYYQPIDHYIFHAPFPDQSSLENMPKRDSSDSKDAPPSKRTRSAAQDPSLLTINAAPSQAHSTLQTSPLLTSSSASSFPVLPSPLPPSTLIPTLDLNPTALHNDVQGKHPVSSILHLHLYCLSSCRDR